MNSIQVYAVFRNKVEKVQASFTMNPQVLNCEGQALRHWAFTKTQAKGVVRALLKRRKAALERRFTQLKYLERQMLEQLKGL